jgi:hypothetical protein
MQSMAIIGMDPESTKPSAALDGLSNEWSSCDRCRPGAIYNPLHQWTEPTTSEAIACSVNLGALDLCLADLSISRARDIDWKGLRVLSALAIY